jgi:hypothetical protein
VPENEIESEPGAAGAGAGAGAGAAAGGGSGVDLSAFEGSILWIRYGRNIQKLKDIKFKCTYILEFIALSSVQSKNFANFVLSGDFFVCILWMIK